MPVSAFMQRLALMCVIAAVLLSGCHRHQESGFRVLQVDRTVSSESKYPLAVDPARVGTYPPNVKSGAGYFYDDVLEYRVWLHPVHGADPLNGEHDYYAAFAKYETAEAFSKKEKGAEEPLVLVRQREWINEPEPGKYSAEKGERIAEWQVKWLAEDKRTPTSIQDFLAHPRPAKSE